MINKIKSIHAKKMQLLTTLFLEYQAISIKQVHKAKIKSDDTLHKEKSCLVV